MAMAKDEKHISSAEEPPLSPASRLFLTPRFNFFILTMLGFRTKINPTVLVEGLKASLLKHPRFCMIPKGRSKWVTTDVNLEDHVIVPDVDPELGNTDQFLEDYMSNLSTVPMNMSKPLWELHLLNLKTSEAESTAIFRIHHSIGDGTSLMSLILASARKSSDPTALPEFPTMIRRGSSSSSDNKKLWTWMWFLYSTIVFFFNTCVDVLMLVATIFFLKDNTAIKGGPNTEFNPKRFVHRAVSLDDIKFIKSRTKASVNDVVLGVIDAALGRYLNRKHCGGATSTTTDNIRGDRVRAAVIVNLRPLAGIMKYAEMMAKGSTGGWGNCFGYVLYPFFPFKPLPNQLDHVQRAKTIMDRKKFSMGSLFSFASYKYIMAIFGDKIGAATTTRAFTNTTMTISNVVGPLEEISLYGHPLSFVAPTIYGHPHALTMHFVSYINKMMIILAVDPTVIPDPYQFLDDLEESLEAMKFSILKK